MQRHENTCSPDAAMTSGLIFHLSCFSVALRNWSCIDIFIDGVRFLSNKKVRCVFHVHTSEIKFCPSVFWLNFCSVAQIIDWLWFRTPLSKIALLTYGETD